MRAVHLSVQKPHQLLRAQKAEAGKRGRAPVEGFQDAEEPASWGNAHRTPQPLWDGANPEAEVFFLLMRPHLLLLILLGYNCVFSCSLFLACTSPAHTQPSRQGKG